MQLDIRPLEISFVYSEEVPPSCESGEERSRYGTKGIKDVVVEEDVEDDYPADEKSEGCGGEGGECGYHFGRWRKRVKEDIENGGERREELSSNIDAPTSRGRGLTLALLVTFSDIRAGLFRVKSSAARVNFAKPCK